MNGKSLCEDLFRTYHDFDKKKSVMIAYIVSNQ